MNLALKIYTDDTLTEVKRTAEADRLKIPYRVAMTVAETLDQIDIDSQDDILKAVTHNLDKVDKIVKATFGVTDTELECVDIAELGAVAKEIYKWAIGKISSLKGAEKNAQLTQ